MRIRFEFSGGYGGLFAKRPLAYQADTDELPEETRERLLELIRSSMILESEPELASRASAPPRDVFVYKLSIHGKNIAKSFTFDDATAPAALHPLLAYLRELAVERRMKR